MYKLRPYQQQAVQATLQHFRVERSPAVIVLPTGAGKSLVIAELARLAKGRVLILAHVRELVEQNHAKYISFDLEAGIFSAGLHRKESSQKTIFGSIQSIARAEDSFFQDFSLVVIDECHRISMESETQYFHVVSKLQKANPQICILGLTATPYRLGYGWIYQYNSHTRIKKTDNERFFKKCIYELSIKYMIQNQYLTPPLKLNSPVASYDFSSLKLQDGHFITSQIEGLLKDQNRVTPLIIQNIIDISKDRKGVMIFTSSVSHAKEIMSSLPSHQSALVTGDTDDQIREKIIHSFKDKKLKYLVNVSVLTTGFDAPHVDVIAILRPTESVSLYQQIIGRGLRLSPDKTDCLILDYTGQNHDLYAPEIQDSKPSPESVPVEVPCPACGLVNQFWGVLDFDGNLIEHYGRKCQAAYEDPKSQDLKMCGFLFRYKRCEKCGDENDIAARQCRSCDSILIDPDKKLKEAMSLKDAHVMRVDTMKFEKSFDRKGNARLEIQYYDVDANVLKEYFYLDSSVGLKSFYFNYIRMHTRLPGKKIEVHNLDDALEKTSLFRNPMFIIARKEKQFWKIREKIFND